RQNQLPHEFDAAKIDRDLIAERLVQDSLERAGKMHKLIAAEYIIKPSSTLFTDGSSVGDILRQFKNGHHLPVTCVAVSPDYQNVISASKDGSIIKWDFSKGRRVWMIRGQKKNKKGKVQ